MFTGIITDVGTIKKIEASESGKKITFKTSYDLSNTDLGASISCNGACLTVIEKNGGDFIADLSNETLNKTSFANAKEGDEINFEKALRVGDELGGHYVTGHVDGLAEIVKLNVDSKNDDANWQVGVKLPQQFSKFVATKGSITLNGVSLTVNDVNDEYFTVNIIPHTLQKTNLKNLKIGDKVNFEIDIIARYFERMIAK
jgi:riboflavin synthase